MNAFSFELLGGANALPGAGELDENALRADASRLVKRDEFTALGDAAFGIEAQARGYFGGYAPRSHVQNLASEQHEEAIDKLLGHFLVAAAAFGSQLRGFIDKAPVLWHLRGMIQEGRVSGGVLGMVPGDRLDISRVGHNSGVSLQRLQ